MKVIMSFGQKSYLVAEAEADMVGIIGWQVENLITRVDELYLEDSAETEKIVYALAQSVEEASIELQSEVSFIFLPAGTDPARVNPFKDAGYDETSVKEIKIPAWREAVQEIYSEGMTILTKKLRQDRVLKPI